MSFSLKKDKQGVVVVGVDGQLIVGNRQELKQKVLDTLEGGGKKFVIDFTKTGYIDSSGLGVLVSLSKKIREQGGDLRLCGLNEDLQTLFELTKLDTLFAIARTPEEALAAFYPGTTPQPLQVRRRATGGETEIELSLDVPSDLEYVGPAVELIADELPGGPLSPRRIRFNFRTAFAEALANAIAYGNHRDPRRVVRVRVEVARDAVRLYVTDEGKGFDPRGVPDPTLPERLEREDGRGLFVLRSLVDQVAFNEKGNSVCLTLRAG